MFVVQLHPYNGEAQVHPEIFQDRAAAYDFSREWALREQGDELMRGEMFARAYTTVTQMRFKEV